MQLSRKIVHFQTCGFPGDDEHKDSISTDHAGFLERALRLSATGQKQTEAAAWLPVSSNDEREAVR